MKKNNIIYDALSGIDEKYLERSEDINEIKAQFKRKKIHMAEKYASFAACLAFSVIVGLNIFEKNDITQRESMLSSSYQQEQMPATEADASASNGIEHTTILKENITLTSATVNSKNVNTSKTTVKSKDACANTQNEPTDDYIEVVTDIPDKKPENTGETVRETQATAVTVITVKTTVKTQISNVPSITETIPDEEQPAMTNIIINPIYNGSIDKDPSTDIRDISSDKNWNDMNIYEKFDLIVFNDMNYLTNGTIASADRVGEKIGDMTVSGYDPYQYKTNYSEVEVFRINDIPETESVAVRFKEHGGYYIYTIVDYFYK